MRDQTSVFHSTVLFHSVTKCLLYFVDYIISVVQYIPRITTYPGMLCLCYVCISIFVNVYMHKNMFLILCCVASSEVHRQCAMNELVFNKSSDEP